MPSFSITWKQHFNSLTHFNTLGNQNVENFTGAMDWEGSTSTLLKSFNDANGFILIADNHKEVIVVHSPMNFGGQLYRPEDKIGCLLGLGKKATGVILDHKAATKSTSIRTSPIEDIKGCDEKMDLAALPSIVNEEGLINFEGIQAFIPAPYIRQAILNIGSYHPLDLIIAVRAATTEHIRLHSAEDGFDESDTNAHSDMFYLWCMGVAHGTIPETRFSLNPDDNDIDNFVAIRHRDKEPVVISIEEDAAEIDPSTPRDSTSPSADILRMLSAGIARTHEEAAAQNSLHREQLDFIKEKESKKKNKWEKWHESSKRLVLNAASTNGDTAAEDIPESYLRIINSETAGMADKELYNQMTALGFPDVGFAHGLASAIHIGDLLWTNKHSPSNVSLFTVYEQDPLSTTQASRYLHLHLLSKNTEGKSMDEIKASQKQEVKVPATYEEMVQSLHFYGGISEILYGPNSALTTGIKSVIFYLQKEKMTFKTRIAGDREYAAKFLYALEIRIQRWKGECQQEKDRSCVNDRIVDFDDVVEQVLNSSLNIVLPPTFVKPTEQEQTGSGAGGASNKKEKENKKRKERENNANERMTKNEAPITEFLMSEGEDWRRDYAGKNTKDRPKWDKETFMCVRWYVRGECFNDCNNKNSHSKADDVPQEKKDAFSTYLKKIRDNKQPKTN